MAGKVGTSANGGAGGGTGGSSGGTGGSSGSASGAGGNATCPPGGSSGDAATGSEAGGGPACGVVIYTTRDYAPECQAWMDANCCELLAACAASTLCRTLVDCVNACAPMTSSCIACCTQGLSASPPELEAVAACTKSGVPMPDNCDWPRPVRP